MMKMMNGLALAVALTVTLASSAQAQPKPAFKVLKSFAIGSNGGWDYITVDGANNRLYVSHASQVNVIDATTGDSVGVIANTNGVHGIALVPALGKGYTSNGKANTCTIFDIKTLKVTGEVAARQNPDAIFYDEFSKKVFAFNGRSKDATVIDPATDKVVATIPLGAKPETGVSDLKGHVYVNAETTNEVLVIDANTLKVTNRFKIVGGEAPSGLDIDRKNNRLFIGCGDSKTMVVMDALTGKCLAKFASGDCDGLVFDPELQLAFSSNNEGNITVVHELSAHKFEAAGTIVTETSARTIGIDPQKHLLYLPAAKMQASQAGNRPKATPGTFHILVVGKP
jgi:YVTN family beta-propeller protein